MDTRISEQRDALESPVVSPSQVDERWRGMPVFHLRNDSVYIIFLCEKEFLTIAVPEFSLGELLVGHNPNCATHWASFWCSGASEGEQCRFSPYFLLALLFHSESDQQLGFHILWLHSCCSEGLCPLPLPAPQAGQWIMGVLLEVWLPWVWLFLYLGMDAQQL